MSFSFENISKILGLAVVIIGAVVSGFFVVLGWLDKKRKDRQDIENKSEDRVINLMKDEMTLLTKKVEKQDDDIKKLTVEVHQLKEENQTMRNVLQGKDPESQKFKNEAMQAIQIVNQTHNMMIELVKNSMTFYGSIEGHLKSIDNTLVGQANVSK